MINLPSYINKSLKESPLFDGAFHIIKKLQQVGHVAYFAGGCVRDAYLGRIISDIDIATSATPKEIMKLFPNHKPVGAQFGVILVMIQRNSFEVATFRKDGNYSDGRRPDMITYSNPKNDSKRRDFTINGIFFDPVSLNVYDFVGGIKDLKKKNITTIGDPSLRFNEDKLRILRFFRFSTQLKYLGFQKDSSIFPIIKKMSAQLKDVSRERIKEELLKIVQTKSITDVLNEFNTFHLSLSIFHLQELPFKNIQFAQHVLETSLSFNFFPIFLIALFLEKPPLLLLPLQEIINLFVLSNKEKQVIKDVLFIFSQFPLILESPLHQQKRLLRNLHTKEALHLIDSYMAIYKKDPKPYQRFVTLYHQHKNNLYPPHYINGDTLITKGLNPSKRFSTILTIIENHQLDETINTKEECFKLLEKLLEQY